MNKKLGMLSAVLLLGAVASGQPGRRGFHARLSGFTEVPSVSTAASGTFRATIDATGTSLSYTETYSNLEGNVIQSHVHLGQVGVSGGVMFFLCANSPITPPAGTPACPTPGGTVSGVVTADQVIGPAGQGVDAGQFAEVLRAIRAGYGYANVHSSKWPAGEIRGQLVPNDDDDDR